MSGLGHALQPARVIGMIRLQLENPSKLVVCIIYADWR